MVISILIPYGHQDGIHVNLAPGWVQVLLSVGFMFIQHGYQVAADPGERCRIRVDSMFRWVGRVESVETPSPMTSFATEITV